MFFDVYARLCKKANKKPSAVAEELGINKSNVSNWKNNGYTPRGDALQRIADYFGVSVDYLLGTEQKETPTKSGERRVSRDDMMFALSRGREEAITDAMLDEILNFADYVIQRENAKKNRS